MNRIIKNIFGYRFKNVEAYKIKKLKINLRDATNQIIKYILLKPKEEKSNEDIATLKSYILLKSKFIDKLIQDHIDENMQEIIIILSMINAFYIEIKTKNEVIYNMHENAEHFYIIIEGGVSILNVEQIDCEMNSEDYYKLILKYKRNKEDYLLSITLEENKINFPIELKDVDILDKILLKIYLLSKNNLKILKDNPNYIEVIFDKLGLKNSDFGIESYRDKLDKQNKKLLIGNEKGEKKEEENKENEENNKNSQIELIKYDVIEDLKCSKENEEIILEKIKDIATDTLCRKYYFLVSTPELPTSYFRYKEERTLQELDYFGENETKFYSNKVVSNTDRVELLCFKNDIYNEILSHMKSKFVGTQVDFLLDNFFFKSIYKGYFDKIYLKFFEYTKYYINQTIIEENEPLKYIYFVKNGNVKIYSNRSIIQNHILIEVINNILKKKNSFLVDGKSANSALNINLYPEIKGDLQDILKEIKIKKNIHLMNYQEKQCIGFECFYFGFNSLYTAIAASEKVEVYKITIEKLIKILTVKNKKALNEFSRQSEKAIKILLNRIIKINNSLLLNYSLQSKEIVHKINLIFEKAINLIQAQNNQIRGNNTLNLKRKEHKKFDLLINNKENNDNQFSKRKSNSVENNNYNNDELNKKWIGNKNMIIFNKNLIDNNLKENNKNVNLLDKYDLTAQIKIFDQKANSIQQIYRELERESYELGRLAHAEKRQINHLKRQNIYCQDFFKLSQGEKRVFVKTRYNSVNSNDIQNYKKSKIKSFISLNKNRNKKIFHFPKNINQFREIYPFNSRYNNYMPYKYDMSKTMLVNKKIFEFSVFNRQKKSSNDFDNKVKMHKYKSSGDVDIDKFNLKKKKMYVINCQDFFNNL